MGLATLSNCGKPLKPELPSSHGDMIMASEKTRRYGKNILDVVYLKKLNSNLYSKKITCYMKKSKGKAARLT